MGTDDALCAMQKTELPAVTFLLCFIEFFAMA